MKTTDGARSNLGATIDDLVMTYGAKGIVVGAVVGLVLGATVWDKWLIMAIVLGFYGVILGGVVGLGLALARR
jgi:hypothetical protein